MDKLRIVLLTVFAACAYGVVHDQVTIRLCPEYFTVAHPHLFHTSSITLLAFCWGIAATLGLGVILGFLLALVSQEGSAAVFSFPQVRRLVFRLLAVMAGSALVAGVGGYWLSRLGVIRFPDWLASIIPVFRHDRFMAAWFAHGASYLVGLTGSVILYLHIWQMRGRPRVIRVFPQTPGGIGRAALLALVVAHIVWAKNGFSLP